MSRDDASTSAKGRFREDDDLTAALAVSLAGVQKTAAWIGTCPACERSGRTLEFAVVDSRLRVECSRFCSPAAIAAALHRRGLMPPGPGAPVAAWSGLVRALAKMHQLEDRAAALEKRVVELERRPRASSRRRRGVEG